MTKAAELLEKMGANEARTSGFLDKDPSNSGFPTLWAEDGNKYCAISISSKDTEKLPSKGDMAFLCYWIQDTDEGDPTDDATFTNLLDAMKWCTPKGFRFSPDDVKKANDFVANLK